MLKELFIKAHNFVMERLPFTGRSMQPYTNPDGSLGGMVSSDATIEEGAIIPVTAIVMPGAIVKKDAVIKNGDLVTSQGIVRFDGPNAQPVRSAVI